MKKHKELLVTVLTLVGLVVLGTGIGIGLSSNEPVDEPKNSQATQREEVTADGLFVAINKVRVDNGLTPFTRNTLLDKSAGLKCTDMATNGYYEHDNPTTGKHGYDYIDDVGEYYEQSSENLNQGYFLDSADVVTSWMNSDAHAASILDPKFTEIGFAVCLVGTEVTVVQHKIEPDQRIQSQNIQYVQPRYEYRPETTHCTYNDYGGYLNPTMTCRSY